MAKKKAELEQAHARYLVLAGEVQRSRDAHDYDAALRHADVALSEIDEAIQYAQKYGEVGAEHGAAIVATLVCAPLALRREPIDRVQAVLKSSKRVARTLAADADALVAESRSRLALCHHLYRAIEGVPGLAERSIRGWAGTAWPAVEAVLDAWTASGLIVRQGVDGERSLFLATRRGAMVVAKCPVCATTAEAPKAFFYAAQRCDRCRREVSFVIRG